MLRLRTTDLARRALRDGELALVYVGRDVPTWVGQLDGYPLGVLAVVTRDDVALPRQLEIQAQAAGVALDRHPLVPSLRAAVAEALFASLRLSAHELLEQMSGLEVGWAPGAEAALRSRERAAIDRVSHELHAIADDLAAIGRRRATQATMRASLQIDLASSSPEAAAAADRFLAPPTPAPPSRPHVFDDATIAAAIADIAQARATDMPQRLPNGTRRLLLRLPAGVYVVEDGLVAPAADLHAALTQAAQLASAAKERAVIDWDGEWPVLVRSFGERGTPGYRLDQELRRWMRRRPESEPAPASA